MRHLATQRTFIEPRQEWPMAGESSVLDPASLLLLGIERALAPPIVHRRNSFQPMRVVIVGIGQPNLRLLGPSRTPRIVEQRDAVDAATVSQDKSLDTHRATANAFLPLKETAEIARSSGFRKLFADPGQWRVVWWSDFKEILAKQLAHPDRLKDTYRLPCYIQVIEIDRSMTTAELDASLNKETVNDKALYFLTNEIAAKLDLFSVLPPSPTSNSDRTRNTLLPHDRLFRLVVANDPTADVAANLTGSNQNGHSQAFSAATAPKPQLKREIPSCFFRNRDFAISREEALYDMNAEKSFAARLRRLSRKFHPFKRREEMRKWQAMMSGKSGDEQLWNVRPPQGGLSEPNIQQWARQKLVAAGYDAESMLPEWEIFWRRKGLS